MGGDSSASLRPPFTSHNNADKVKVFQSSSYAANLAEFSRSGGDRGNNLVPQAKTISCTHIHTHTRVPLESVVLC